MGMTIGLLWEASPTSGRALLKWTGDEDTTKFGVQTMGSAWTGEPTEDGQALATAGPSLSSTPKSFRMALRIPRCRSRTPTFCVSIFEGRCGEDTSWWCLGGEDMSLSPSSVALEHGEFARVLATEAWGITFLGLTGQTMLWPDALPSSCTMVAVSNSWPMMRVDI